MAGAPLSGIVKQVSSGDTIHVRNKVHGRMPTVKVIVLAGITVPKLGRVNKKENSVDNDEPYAWEAREFLRKMLIGQEVFFTAAPFSNSTNANREIGKVYFPNKDTDIVEQIVSNGFAKVKKEKGKNQNPDTLKLIELEENAMKKGLGIHNNKNKEKHVRKAKYIGKDQYANFVKEYGKKEIPAIIEEVRTGSKVLLLELLLLLPTYHHVTFAIAGIAFDDESLKEEAKFFVEVRLLQRDNVQVYIEKAESNWVTGCVLHPQGDIAEVLLKEGFVRFDNRSMSLRNGTKLQAAEALSKKSRLRMWSSFQTQSKDAKKEYPATVTEIVNGEALMVRLNSGETKKIFFASIQRPKKDRKNEPEEISKDEKKTPRTIFDSPWVFEAREFLRKKLIGKRVNVVEEYTQEREGFPTKICCTVTIGGQNVAESLVQAGLAMVIEPRQNSSNCAPNWPALLEAQEKAKENHEGYHSKVEPPKIKVNDCTGKVAHEMFNLLNKKSRINAIVEHVMSGSRMRLFIPKDSLTITFLLSGIYCKRMSTGTGTGPKGRGGDPEPYAVEAQTFTKDKVLQREVEINIESKDKFGSMIGSLFIGNTNLALALVEEGLATVSPSADRSLLQAEKIAKEKKLNIHQEDQEEKVDVDEDNASERVLNYKDAYVCVVAPDLHIYVHLVDEKKAFQDLTETIRKEFSANQPECFSKSKPPLKGKLYAAKYEDEWYRAKVEKTFMSSERALVNYVDYGNKLEVYFDELAPLPDSCTQAKPFAHEYGLACVDSPPDQYSEDVIRELLIEIGNGRLVKINEEYREHNVSYVSIIDPETKEDFVKKCVANGLFLAPKNRRGKKFASLIDEYYEAQEEAQKKRLLIWEYGDVREDDAKEFGLGK